jgi:hypothetical protein
MLSEAAERRTLFLWVQIMLRAKVRSERTD